MVLQQLCLEDLFFEDEMIDKRKGMARLRIARVFRRETQKDPRNPDRKCSTGLVVYGCNSVDLLARGISDKISLKHPMLTVDDLPRRCGWMSPAAREHLIERIRLDLIGRTLREMLEEREIWYMEGMGNDIDDIIRKSGWNIQQSVVDEDSLSAKSRRNLKAKGYQNDGHMHGRPGRQERRRSSLLRRATGVSVSAA